MDNKLYLARGESYIPSRAHHPEEPGETVFSEYKLVISENVGDANRKLLFNLNQNSRYAWRSSEIKELNSGKDILLEKRVEILGEIFPIIN